MVKIDLEKIPNQMFDVLIDNVMYRVQLRTIQGLTYMSVWANDELLFNSQLCAPNVFVNPYNYVSSGGKFMFSCIDGEYPNYQNFGNTQELLFYTAEEVDA